MVIMHGDRVSEKVNHAVIPVPFEVAVLTVKKSLKEAFLSVGISILRANENKDNKHPKVQWQLHRNGYFISFKENSVVAIMTQSSYYEGTLEQ